MNFFEVIRSFIERETGLQVRMDADNIAEGDILLTITEIEKTNVDGQYCVSGIFQIQTGEHYGWERLQSFLDLNVTDTRAVANFAIGKSGFYTMDVDFSLIVNRKKGYVSPIKKVSLEVSADV